VTVQPTSDAERHRYRDARLSAALKAHRAAVKGDASAEHTLQALEGRLRYVDRILGDWDKHHGRQAAAALDAGQHERAAGLAWLCWDDELRRSLLAQVRMQDAAAEAAERISANAEMGRELVEEGAL
jgi:hypothetical protein